MQLYKCAAILATFVVFHGCAHRFENVGTAVEEVGQMAESVVDQGAILKQMAEYNNILIQKVESLKYQLLISEQKEKELLQIRVESSNVDDNIAEKDAVRWVGNATVSALVETPWKKRIQDAKKRQFYQWFLRGAGVTFGAVALAGAGTFAMTGGAVGAVLGIFPTAWIAMAKKNMRVKWDCRVHCPLTYKSANGWNPTEQCGAQLDQRTKVCQQLDKANACNAMCCAKGKCAIKRFFMDMSKRLLALLLLQCGCFKTQKCRDVCLNHLQRKYNMPLDRVCSREGSDAVLPHKECRK